MSVKYPIVTIIGRQNVGKSTLFNAIIKEKKAIVDSTPGLTRDVISYRVTYNSIVFVLCDTPGLDLPDSSALSAPILANAREHLKKSSIIIQLMENPAPEPFDVDLADMVRKLSIPAIVAVNKMDNDEHLQNMANFYETGFNDILPISAKRRFNLPLLLDKIVDMLPSKKTALTETDLKISVVGRPNSGKSTLLNALIGYDRAVVSEIPGTTRDSVDEEFMYHNKRIQIIDTAGIRKKSKIDGNIEFYSHTRTIESINMSDVVVHLIDATMGFTDTDKKISDEIIKAHKPIIITINKWDAIDKDDKTFEKFRDRLLFRFYRAQDFPIISISALNRVRLHRILDMALELKEKASKKIETPRLNRIIAELQDLRRIPQLGNKIRIYYATQIDSIPPKFKLFVNNTDLFRKDILRYFEKSLQKELDLTGIPIILLLTGKKKKK